MVSWPRPAEMMSAPSPAASPVEPLAGPAVKSVVQSKTWTDLPGTALPTQFSEESPATQSSPPPTLIWSLPGPPATTTDGGLLPSARPSGRTSVVVIWSSPGPPSMYERPWPVRMTSGPSPPNTMTSLSNGEDATFWPSPPLVCVVSPSPWNVRFSAPANPCPSTSTLSTEPAANPVRVLNSWRSPAADTTNPMNGCPGCVQSCSSVTVTLSTASAAGLPLCTGSY